MKTGQGNQTSRMEGRKAAIRSRENRRINYLQFDEIQCDKRGTSVPPRSPSAAAQGGTAGTRVCQMSQMSGNAVAQAALTRGGVGAAPRKETTSGIAFAGRANTAAHLNILQKGRSVPVTSVGCWEEINTWRRSAGPLHEADRPRRKLLSASFARRQLV